MIDMGDLVRFIPSDRSKEIIEGRVVDIDRYHPEGGSYTIVNRKTGEWDVVLLRDGVLVKIEEGEPFYRNATLEGGTVDNQRRFAAPPYRKPTRRSPTRKTRRTRPTGLHYFSEEVPIPHGGRRLTDFRKEINWDISPCEGPCAKLVWMSPEEFLRRIHSPISFEYSAWDVMGNVSIESGGSGFCKEILNRIYRDMIAGKPIDNLYLFYDDTDRWPDHDGMHRAAVAYLLGIDSVPVCVVKECKSPEERLKDWHTKRDLGNKVDEKEVIRNVEKRLWR